MNPEIRQADGSGYRPANVRVDDYDPNWARQYTEEAHLLEETLGPHVVAVDHIGNTSISGMPSKPIIDILASVTTYDEFDLVVQRLATIGYLHTPESEADDPARRVFRKGPEDMNRRRTHHLHMTEINGYYSRRIIAFRNYLQCHPDDARAYAQLKRELAVKYENDSHGYTAAKSRFVTDIEHKAGVGLPADCDA